MTASDRSYPHAQRPRSAGPSGIDWTSAASDCPACGRSLLSPDLPATPLLSRRTHAALAAAALALSSTAPAVVLAAEPHQHHRSHAGLNDSDPVDPVVEAPGDDDAGSAPGDADPEPTAPDPDVPDPETSPAPNPVAQEPVGAPDEPDNPVDSEADPPPADDAEPSPEPPVMPPEGGSAPPPPTADQSGGNITPPVAGIAPDRSRPQRHAVYMAGAARSHRSSRISAPTRTSAAAPSRTITRSVASGAATALPRAGRAQRGDRSHVVRPGESLWSIASDVLGGRVSTARIAAEVQRLWELNGQHIGTGDPDLLPAGTRLTLR